MLVDKASGTSKVVPMKAKAERWNDPRAHVALKKLYEERVKVSQAEFGAEHGIGTQGMVWQYLNGHTPLSLEAAAKFARGLGCTIQDISPTMAEALKTDIVPVLGPKGWWRSIAKAAMVMACALPLYPQDAHASFLSATSGPVYYVKSLWRYLLHFLTTFRTARQT